MLKTYFLGLSRFVDFSWFVKIVDFILLASTNQQNTRSGTFHRQEYIFFFLEILHIYIFYLNKFW